MISFSSTSDALGPNPRERSIVLGIISGLVVLLLTVPESWWGYTALFVGTAAILSAVVLSVLHGRGDWIIAGWLLVYPLGYYFLPYPREKSILTLDRAFIAILLVTICFSAKRRDLPRIPELRKAAVFWLLFLLVALSTVPSATSPMNSARLWWEALLSPVLLGWYILRYFDLSLWNLRILHAVTCIMVTYVAAIGIAEVVLQTDLLPLPDGDLYFAGDYQKSAIQIVVRPNGPFSTDNSFAMVGMTCFFFLLFLRKVLAPCFPRWQMLLHRIGVSSALCTTILPLFRSVMISLMVILLVDACYSRGWRRAVRAGAIGGFSLVFLLVRLWLPAVFEERSNPENLYGRFAQQVQTFRMFADHPLLGVGLNNFHDAAQANSSYATYFDDIEAVDYPHNNLGAVLAETGLAGFVPFVLAQVFLFCAFWRAYSTGFAGAQTAWKYFLFLFLGYWINGMALTICYFSDLNLIFMLVLSLLYRYTVSNPFPAASVLAGARS